MSNDRSQLVVEKADTYVDTHGPAQSVPRRTSVD